MKSALIAAASVVGIIIVRMILSITLSEQIANVFTGLSLSFLLCYFIINSSKRKSKAAK